VLQFNGIPEIHFLLNPGSVRIDGRDTKLQRFRYCTSRIATSDEFQHLQFPIGQTIERPGKTLGSDAAESLQKKVVIFSER
jgi:hypothetical protein